MVDDEDTRLFREATQGIRPLLSQRADLGQSKRPDPNLQVRRAAAQQRSNTRAVDGLSDQFVIDVEPDAFLCWRTDGLQERQLNRLRAGDIPFEGTLDLHGYSVERARETLWAFLAEATRREIRCVRVSHGKGFRANGKPHLKSHVNTWLRQHSQVLGFTSCQPRHGGNGSLYVLLRRTLLEGRDGD